MIDTEAQVGWIAFQLKQLYGIEKTDDQVHAIIFNDAGRDSGVCRDMIEAIAEDKDIFDEFARSLATSQKIIIWERQPRWSWPVYLFGVAVGFIAGLLF